MRVGDMSSECRDAIELFKEFKALENDAEVLHEFPDGCFPCVRMDGVRHSRSYLKNVLINKAYDWQAKKSAVAVYGAMRHHLDSSMNNNFVCFIVFSDEVSFVLSPSLKNPRYGRRVMKICTILNGGLSSAFTSLVRKNAQKLVTKDRDIEEFGGWMPQLMSYDARPILLHGHEDVARYIRHRYLVAKRHSYWKVLNLHGHPLAADNAMKKNLDALRAAVAGNGWEEDVHTLLGTFRLFFPQRNADVIAFEEVNDEGMELDVLSRRVCETLQCIGYTA